MVIKSDGNVVGLLFAVNICAILFRVYLLYISGKVSLKRDKVINTTSRRKEGNVFICFGLNRVSLILLFSIAHNTDYNQNGIFYTYHAFGTDLDHNIIQKYVCLEAYNLLLKSATLKTMPKYNKI